MYIHMYIHVYTCIYICGYDCYRVSAVANLESKCSIAQIGLLDEEGILLEFVKQFPVSEALIKPLCCGPQASNVPKEPGHPNKT